MTVPAVVAFKFATCVVLVTTRGAVPVAILLINCGAVIFAVASTRAVPKLPTFALLVTLNRFTERFPVAALTEILAFEASA